MKHNQTKIRKACEDLAETHNAEYGTLYLRETLGRSYSVIDVARQKDL